MRLPVQFLLIVGLVIPTLLAGCGGGGGAAPPPPSQYAGRYEGTVTTGNNNVTTPVVFRINAAGVVSTTFRVNGANQTFSAPLGNVDANGNFRAEVTSPTRVIFVGTIKPNPITNVMTIVGTFTIPSTGLQGTYTLQRVDTP